MIQTTTNTTALGSNVETRTFTTHIPFERCPVDASIFHLLPVTVQGSHIVGTPHAAGEHDGPVRPCPNGCSR